MTTRRHFITTVGAALGAASLGLPRSLRAQGADRLNGIGLQLYTVRSLMKLDFEGTLARVAEVGYSEVEFAGYFGKTPGQVRSALSAHRLRARSGHFDLPKDADDWKRTLDLAKDCGHEWATVAWINEPLRRTADDWHHLANHFNVLGTAANAAGMRFAYHNHDFEFKPAGDRTGLDILLSNTEQGLVDFEMDIYWVTKAGADPLDLIARYPGRFPLMHAKDATAAPERKMVDVGAGTIDFGKIFALKKSGLRHVYVEHDEPADPMQSIANSYRYLDALRY